MVDTVLFYISAAQDLEYERDLLGRSVTEIPVTLGWRIQQTPLHGETADLEMVTQADLHVLLLAGDIRAPVGLEWLAARRTGRQPVPFLRQGIPRTPAAQAFIRYIEDHAVWKIYQDRSDLHGQVLKLLADHILERTIYYNLSTAEQDRLVKWRDQLQKAAGDKVEETRGGAGESGLILSPERYVPTQGILLKPPDENE
jgi:hypothetical protein